MTATQPSTSHLARRRAPWRGLFLGLAGAGLVASCAGEPGPEAVGDVATLGEAITGACSLQTVGLPCDPDGGGGVTECEGVCWIGADRQPACVAVASLGMTNVDLNGRICGDSAGQDCGRSCENGQCVAKNARLGSACRPDGRSTTCDGLCTLIGGEPQCDPVTACADVNADGCSLHACGFDDNTTGCQDYPLSDGTTCDDGQSCTTGDACDGRGACVPEVDNCGPGNTGGGPGTGGGGPGTGGAATTGGASTTGGRSGGGPGPSEPDDPTPVEITGGGCSVGGAAGASGAGGLLLLLGLGALRRRGARRID